MKDFLEKWNTNSIFKTKIKLGIYTLFVVIVAIFAFSIRGNNYTDTAIDELSNYNDNKETDNISIEIPKAYNYTINININESIYKYTGTKNLNTKTIIKTADGITTNYIYEDNKYYKDSIEIDNLVEKKEIYNIVEYNYLNLENINTYLAISAEKDGKNLVYIKDIILGSESEEYITITIDKNKINIDYTSLMKLFDKTIESSVVEVIIEEIE